MKHPLQDRVVSWFALLLVLASAACSTGAGTLGASSGPNSSDARVGGDGLGGCALTSGWATFGLALPAGVATSGVQIGTLSTQTDVKARWADGTIRFAVLTTNVQTAGTYTISAATAPRGSFVPLIPAASVALTIGSVSYTARLPSSASADTWLSGPLVYEGRSVVAPTSSANTAAHPFLRVVFDTRVYTDGKARVDVTVENVLDMAGAKTTTYDAAITVAGRRVFSKSAVEHYYLTRWRRVFEVGATPTSAVRLNLTPFHQARALPPFLAMITNVVTPGAGPSYDILREGALVANMPAHGGRQELAPYPDWTARYLAHQDPTQRAMVMANGDLSGSWPIHVREAEGGVNSGLGSERLVSLDQRPTLWLDGRAAGNGVDHIKGSPMPIREYGSLNPGPGQSPLIPDNAHQPSLAYVPYLITGDRYYAEEMAFWANYAMLRTYKRDARGLLLSNEVRGIGWALRNLADAAAYYPEASPVRAYLGRKLLNNLQALDDYANAQDPAANPFRILWIGTRPDGPQFISMWEQNYLAYAIDRASKHGFAGGLAHRDAIARLQLRLFTSDPDYPRAGAAPYVLGVGTPNGSGFDYYKTMAEIWNVTRSHTDPFAGHYGPEARLNLMMGVESGWSGAQGAYDYLWPFIGATDSYCPDGGPKIPYLACRAGWALDFYAK
jgi:hypothetical protein